MDPSPAPAFRSLAPAALLDLADAWVEAGRALRVDAGDLVCEDAPGGPRRLRPPLLMTDAAGASDPASWLAALRRPRETLVVLLQAGALALGRWRGGRLVAHWCEKKYVVRGHGRAQATHLRTKGRSREGSRLRLRNHAALLVQLNERLGTWRRAHGEPDGIFRSVPVRLWGEVFATRPPPPFGRDDPRVQKIPLHVHRPGFEELQRVYRALAAGGAAP